MSDKPQKLFVGASIQNKQVPLPVAEFWIGRDVNKKKELSKGTKPMWMDDHWPSLGFAKVAFIFLRGLHG